MKPMLVIGLGNTLLGDDGAGCRVVELLSRERALERRADYAVGGCDLLRLADRMEGRGRVVLVDALLSAAAPGTVTVHEEPFDEFDAGWRHAHHPSAAQAVGLLKATSPELRGTAFTLVAIAVPGLERRAMLASMLPSIAARVRRALVLVARRAGPARSADARQLLAAEHVDDAARTDAAGHGHERARVG